MIYVQAVRITVKYPINRRDDIMDKKDNISVSFSISGSNSLHKLELGRSLLRFAEFDFTYFWEQCIEAGRNARKTGRISKNLEDIALGAAAKCHPYVEACLATEFDGLVTDCIIAYICHSEGIGPEELWNRCISPKSLYEREIFNRVSEYKTGRAINQWINIVRMQEYARSKLKFVYDNETGTMLRPLDYRARREYFDLAFAVAANETGCDMRKMPSVRKYSPSSLPDCVFMMGRVSKTIYKRLSDVLADAPLAREKNLNDHNRDSTALDAFSYMKDMPRPENIDMNLAMENIAALPETVYLPDSFKAVIDLEFTCMQEEGIYLSRCPRCGKFFRRELDEKSPYCNRINSSGMTCAEQVEEELGIDSMKHPEAENVTEAAAEAASPEIPASPEKPPVNGQAASVQRSYPRPEGFDIDDDDDYDDEDDEEIFPREMPRELEKRCQKVYNLLYKRIGKVMSDEEFREWSKFLSDLKRDYRNGDAEIPQVEDFLVYWELAAKKSSRRQGKKTDEAANVRQGDSDNPDTSKADRSVSDTVKAAAWYGSISNAETVVGGMSGSRLADNGSLSGLFDEAERSASERLGSDVAPESAEGLPGNRVVKPFSPPKYNTVLEAMLDGKYKSDELLGGDEEDTEIRVGGRKVTLPDWERVTRE